MYAFFLDRIEMCLRTVIIVSLFGLVCGSKKTSSHCQNVIIEGQDKNLTYLPIRVLSSCLANYTNPGIKSNCENFTKDGDIIEDIFLFTLVRGAKSEYPYHNIYCAICNDELEFNTFPPFLKYRIENDQRANPGVDPPSSIFRNLSLNRARNELISNHHQMKYVFKVVKSLKVHNYSQDHHLSQRLFHHSEIKSCDLPSNSSHESSLCQNTSSSTDRNCDSNDIDLNKLIDLFEVISLVRENDNWTPDETFFPKKPLQKLTTCKYADKEGRPCLWNGFLVKGVDFTFGENGDIYLMQNNTKWDRHQYTNITNNEDIVYFCQPKITNKNQYCIQVMNSIISSSRRLSLFFVTVYLIINGNRRYLSNLADKFTYSYYITLLAMYIREEISEWQVEDEEGCFLKYYAYKYLSQSYSIWILICSFYVWYIIRFSKEEITTDSKSTKGQLKIYLTACLFGWLTPAIFSLIFSYLEPTPDCPPIEGYNSLKICQRPDNKCPYFWFSIAIISISSAIVVVLFVNACYCYYFAKSIYNRYCKFDKLRARMVFLFKIVYSIGLYSMLAMYSLLGLSDAMYAILTHLWSFHGTVIFFVYSFKMTILKQMFKDKNAVSESDSDKTSARRKNNLIQAHVSRVQRNDKENEYFSEED